MAPTARDPACGEACSRLPLNFAPLPVFWLWPRMTTSLLAFNLASTMYLAVGSLHEEARLREAFGQAYAANQRSGVPCYLPVSKSGAAEATAKLRPQTAALENHGHSNLRDQPSV